MKHIFFLILALACTKLPPKKPEAPADPFSEHNIRGCFLIYDLKTDRPEHQSGTTCQERFPACSTFKVPLSVMAFDANLLKDEKQVLKWDGEKRFLDAWNKDHTAETWMRDSVVWFSQRLTPKLGEKKFQKYLDGFDYGNKNLRPGITTAWLNRGDRPENALSLSPDEQLEFMKKLWREELPVSKRSMEITKRIMFLETLPNGFQLSGKTGSNFFDEARRLQLGWFIAHFKKGDQEYLTVFNLGDVRPYEQPGFGGLRAKELTKKLFSDYVKGKGL